jgi:inosine-uridine nucleoside N-ribohydrolase
MLGELRERELTVVALGPLTNIARLLVSGRPELANIREIIIVAGNRDGGQPFYLNASNWFRFSDFNFMKDPLAAEIVVNSSIPVTMLPFELSSQFVIEGSLVADIAEGEGLMAWVASRSGNWLRFMRRWTGLDGFHPFDLAAFLYLEFRHQFEMSQMYARVSRERTLLRLKLELLVEPDRSFAGQSRVTYVHGVDREFSGSLADIIR